MKKILLLLIFLLIIPAVSAKEGTMSLLAVKEGGEEGSAASLFLEIQPGKGRVFLETIPLSKFDTQISTRFAKDIACDYLDKNCDKYDFFYTIRADSSIIGGPSAGAAIAVLTVAVLENTEVDKDLAITGTINSGGVIGPVGGLKKKIEAASSINIKTVLIPKGERFLKEDGLTLDLADYGKKYEVAVVEVSDLTEALYYFTGKKFKKEISDLDMSSAYEDTMGFLAEDLCNRTKNLQKEVSKLILTDRSNVDDDFVLSEKQAVNLSNKGERAFNQKEYYSSASYCFGANIKYRTLLIDLKNYKSFNVVEKDIEEFEDNIDEIEIETITDLQAYMVVKERLREAYDSVEKARDMDDYEAELGYAIERLYSATSWSKFFDVDGKKFNFDRASLEQSCVNKIAEAEERYSYARIFFPKTLTDTANDLEYAYEDQKNGDYELCLFKASKVKAEANTVLGAIGVAEDQLDVVLDNKLNAVKRVISEQQRKGNFPILGYSYYEYANNLKDENGISALFYSEYALEMSNLNIYFKKSSFSLPAFNFEKVGLFAIGLILGISIVFIIRKRRQQKY